MKKNLILLFVFISVLSIIATSYTIYQKQLPQKRINEHYSQFVTVIHDSSLYQKVNEEFIPVGDIQASTTLHLQLIDGAYYQLNDSSFYVFNEDVEETQPFQLMESYKDTITVENHSILRSLDGLTSISIKQTIQLPVQRIQNDYFVIFNLQLFRLLTEENTFNTYENAAKEIPVLMYHFFHDKTIKREKDSMFIDIEEFKKQMEYLKNQNYYTPTIKELELFLDGMITLPEKSVIITLDDGATSTFEYAYPIMKENQLRSIFYLITSKIGQWDDTGPKGWHLNDEMLEQLRNDPMIELNSHSHDMHGPNPNKTTKRIDKVSFEEGINDVQISSDFLGNMNSFCYPFGIYNDQAKEILKQVGYTMAFTTSPGKVKPGDDKLELKRQGVFNNTSFNEFVNIVTP